MPLNQIIPLGLEKLLIILSTFCHDFWPCTPSLNLDQCVADPRFIDLDSIYSKKFSKFAHKFGEMKIKWWKYLYFVES